MRRHDYRVLVSDGDGTLCRGKRLGKATQRALERLRASGRKVVLATGEREEELAEFPHLDLFDLVVAENGALLYHPVSRKARRLADPPPGRFVRELRKRRVEPLEVGRVVVSTRRRWEPVVAQAIGDLGMDWRAVRNRKDVMALPDGVDKASGLASALAELGLSATEAVGVGDAENDLALLRACGCGVAVASAVPPLRNQADLVTEAGAGAGIVELVGRLLAGGLPAPRQPCAEGRKELESRL